MARNKPRTGSGVAGQAGGAAPAREASSQARRGKARPTPVSMAKAKPSSRSGVQSKSKPASKRKPGAPRRPAARMTEPERGAAAGEGTRSRAAGATSQGTAHAGDRASDVRGESRGASGAGFGAGPFNLPTWAMGMMPTPQLLLDPNQLSEMQAEYASRLQALSDRIARGESPEISDRRFSDPSWSRSGGLPALGAAVYLLNAEFMMRMAEALQGDKRTVDRVRFATRQWVEAMAPSNFLATNPEAMQRLIDTGGESLRAGVENLLADLGKGRITQTDETAFEVGVNVATSPGDVVFENELMQLIQYRPTTSSVATTPLLMVPPCINKFYILDLQPDNSFVGWAVSQGHTVFMVSWRNVGADQGQLGWDDYLEQGVFEPIRVVREITGAPRVNLLGFCVGGTIVCTALAALAARGDDSVASMTLLTTLLDFADPGVLGVFVDEAHVVYRERTLGQGGILPGNDLAGTFSSLRPNDLVWNYVVGNYLKGEKPPAFDLLYWNSDSTNLPGPMYCWYLRNMYLENRLRQPNALVCAGEPIDLGRVDVPVYILATREDHIVPWQAAYESTQLLGGPCRFVLGASGHIAGTINSASRNRRSFWASDATPPDAWHWLEGAREVPGSWWHDWARWMQDHMGGASAARSTPGGGRFRAIEPAPGRYVKTRAEDA